MFARAPLAFKHSQPGGTVVGNDHELMKRYVDRHTELTYLARAIARTERLLERATNDAQRELWQARLDRQRLHHNGVCMKVGVAA